MAVQAIDRDIQFAVFKPLDAEILLVETDVLNGVERFGPSQPTGLFAPERLGVFCMQGPQFFDPVFAVCRMRGEIRQHGITVCHGHFQFTPSEPH